VQRAVHVGREQREAEASQTAQHRGGADGARGVPRVRIDDVRLDALEADDDAGREDGGADVGHDPVRVGLRGPAVPEEPDGHERGARDHERDAELGFSYSVVALL